MSDETILKTIPKDMEIVQPEAGVFTKEDFRKLVRNALKFSAGPLLVFLGALQAGVELKYALYAMYSPFISIAVDYLTKLNSETPVLREK